jgi:hypothetical protein
VRLSEEGEDTVGLEPLPQQEPVEASTLTFVGGAGAAATRLLECPGEERVLVDLGEGFLDGSGGQIGRYTRGLDLPSDPSTPPELERDFGARDCPRHAGIVEAPVGLQAGDGMVNIGLVVPTPDQANADLGFREFASTEESECRDVGRGPRVRH